VTSDNIVRRNRANAVRSTGPRTRAGKAIVSQNARRHGATAKLDPDRVRLWVKVILASPDLRNIDMRHPDERRRLALALARAEARLGLAEQAMRDFVTSRLSGPLSGREIMEDDPDLSQGLASVGEPQKKDRTRGREPGKRSAKVSDKHAQQADSRHRPLRRYLDEARSRRARAFAAWVSRSRTTGGKVAGQVKVDPVTGPIQPSRVQADE
jgi:hypothetical protein